jgi:hypothetical protein
MRRFISAAALAGLGATFVGAMFVVQLWAVRRIDRFQHRYLNEPDPSLPMLTLAAIPVTLSLLVAGAVWSATEASGRSAARRRVVACASGTMVAVATASVVLAFDGVAEVVYER